MRVELESLYHLASKRWETTIISWCRTHFANLPTDRCKHYYCWHIHHWYSQYCEVLDEISCKEACKTARVQTKLQKLTIGRRPLMLNIIFSHLSESTSLAIRCHKCTLQGHPRTVCTVLKSRQNEASDITAISVCLLHSAHQRFLVSMCSRSTCNLGALPLSS